jgi:HK97 family phage prohead protease
MSFDSVKASFARLHMMLLSTQAHLVKYQALGEGDAATVAGADRAIAQAKFALVKDGRSIGHDLATKVAADTSTEGVVSGIASTDDMDLYRHKIMPGAFSESIRNRGLTGSSAIKLLLDHDHTKLAGVIKRLQYNGGRLEIDAKLALDIEYVRDRWTAMKMLGGFNFSVGFMLTDYEIKTDANKQEYLQINRGDLFEVSLVAFPGNEAATMTSIKAQPTNTLDAGMAAIERIRSALSLIK